MKPFTEVQLDKVSLINKLFKKLPQSNFFNEVNNQLAIATEINESFKAQIDELRYKYGIKPSKTISNKLLKFYSDYLKLCFADSELSDHEEKSLNLLKEYFDLPTDLVVNEFEKIAKDVYKKSIEDVIKDGEITPGERSFIENLEKQLKIPDSIAQEIQSKTITEYFNATTKSIIEDERISPEEEERFLQIAKNLGATIEMDDKTKLLFERYKLYWKLENEDLQPIWVDLNLQKSEVCFAKVFNAEWYELRTITKRINYSGPTARIKIAKGLYYRIGSVSVQPIKQDQLTHLDNGILYLTNKRIIFSGNRKVTNIQLKRILDINAYRDGLEIVKDSGKSPVIKFTKDPDLFYLIMSRLIRESS